MTSWHFLFYKMSVYRQWHNFCQLAITRLEHKFNQEIPVVIYPER